MRLLFVLLACAPKPTAPQAPVAAAAIVETAPMPFTVEQIRDGLPAGTHIRLQVTAEGQPTILQDWTFTACTPESATIASKVLDKAGALIEDEGADTSLWTDLHQHAAFPAASTTREDAVEDLPIGHVETWLYTVRATGDDGVALLKRYHFAKAWPGPPVLFTIEREGTEIFRMTMIERS